MAIKIKAHEEFTGKSLLGIEFVNGIATVEDEAFGRKIAAKFGYEVLEEKKVTKPKTATTRRSTAKKTEE